MGLSVLKSIVLACILAVGGVRGQLDAQIPIGTFQGNSSDTCHDACTALSITLGSKVHFNTSLPESLFSGYYTLMARSTIPLCMIHPTSPEDVSKAIKIISAHSCIFAVKSGGHSMFPGAATAKGGIVFDLHLLNGLELSEDKETAYVGAGNRWNAVYEFLDPFNVLVVGGRVGNIGVGGFLLGELTNLTGGISFISRRYGWGCDNVRNYEIVLANGTIANINYASSPDLFFALRGGGKNFGIVTRFDLETHPKIHEWWGGIDFKLLSPSSLPSQISSRTMSPTLASLIETAAHFAAKLACKLGYCIDLTTLTEASGRLPFEYVEDSDAVGYISVVKLPTVNVYGVVSHFLHTRNLPSAPSFSGLMKSLGKSKTLKSTLRSEYTNSFTEEFDVHNPPGVRMTYQTATFKVNGTFMEEAIRIYVEEIEKVRHLNGIFAATVMQTIHKDEIAMFKRNGGNAFGIEEEDGPLTIFHAHFGWADEKDNEVILDTAKTVIDRSVELGKKMGIHHPFIYQNYAGKGQEVFAGYSEENQKRLRKIQKDVDPEGVFIKLSPGYFTL